MYYTKIKIKFIKTRYNPGEIGRKISWRILVGRWICQFDAHLEPGAEDQDALLKALQENHLPLPFFPNPHSYITGSFS